MSASDRVVIIEHPGLFTTVQDLGRPGLARFGVTTGGAMDRTALILGNRLVGNEPDAAGIECTLAGPVIRFGLDAVIAITGADCGATLDGAPIPRWQPVNAPRGSVLAFAPSPVGPGARAYIAIAGGIETPAVLGSRATDLIGQFGGVDGRMLRAGDQLPVGEPAHDHSVILKRRLAIDPPTYARTIRARVVFGPQADRFTRRGLETLISRPYQVSSRSDRTGIRLIGDAIEHTNGADLISEGIAYGAIQVPGDGQPIVLLAARQTVGGYVKIATVIGADLDRLGQARSGDEIRFVSVSVDEARQATALALRNLDASAVIDRKETGAEPMTDTEMPDTTAWTPDGVIRIIAEAERAGVTQLKLEIASAGIALEFARGGTIAPSTSIHAAGDSPVPDDQFIAVKAPMLGTFYRRPNPEAEPFVAIGQNVAAGDQIGLIEVMKSYHEVNAPEAGIIVDILADDGNYVEFGQTLVTIRPD